MSQEPNPPEPGTEEPRTTLEQTSTEDGRQGEAGFGARDAPALPAGSRKAQDDGDLRSRLPALRHLAVVLAVLGLAAMSTYLFDSVVDLRPWVPGEPLPLGSLFRLRPAGEGQGAGPAGMGPEEPWDLEEARKALSETLGEDLAANLGEETVAREGGSGEAPIPVLGGPHGVQVDPAEWHGLVREIEDPSGQGMAPFYRALAQVASGQPGTLVRVAHWGDSTIAADDVTVTLRRRLQGRFGEGGHGFHWIGRGTQPYRHFDVQWDDFRSWTAHSVIHGDRRDGRYGLGGALQVGNRGSRAVFQTVTRGPVGQTWGVVEVWYQAHPASGPLAVRIDDGAWVSLETRSRSQEDRWFRQEVPEGPPHRLEIAAQGPDVRVYGVVLERSGPGVVWDSLGIVGARANRLLHFQPDHLAAQVAHRSPDLLVLAFGGNEAADSRMNHDRYREQLAEVIRRVRAGRPEAGCLLLAPLDQGEVAPRGGVRTLPELPRIVESQRVVAAQSGCAFFDTWKAMGGEGAMGRWYKSRPRLGWGDYRHATPAGYEVVGNLIYKALLKGFSDYLGRLGGGR